MVPLTVGTNLIKTIPHRLTKQPISQLVLGLIKLTIPINRYPYEEGSEWNEDIPRFCRTRLYFVSLSLFFSTSDVQHLKIFLSRCFYKEFTPPKITNISIATCMYVSLQNSCIETLIQNSYVDDS